MQSLSIPDSWFWTNVVARLLLSIAPGSWIDRGAFDGDINGPQDILAILGPANTWSLLSTPNLWIGAVAGIAMMVAAIYFRRQRDEG
jgi:ABC-2 type transport system permease protein